MSRFLPHSTIKEGNAHTWTLRRDLLPDGTVLVTYYNPIPHGRATDVPHYFDTLVYEQGNAIGASHTYATEAEAWAGHDVLLNRFRTQIEGAA
jgi:hypothetical protein